MKVLQVYSKPFDFHDGDTEDNIQRSSMMGGGIGVYLNGLVCALRSKGVDVVTLRFAESGNNRHVNGGNQHYQIGKLSYRDGRNALKQLKQIIKSERPHVIHVHSVYYSMHPYLINWFRKQGTVVYTLHDISPLCFHQTKLLPDGSICNKAVGLQCLVSKCYRLGRREWWGGDLVRVAINRMHLKGFQNLPAIIVPSAFMKNQLVVNGVNESGISVIPHYSRFTQTCATVEHNSPIDNILFVGRLVEGKGVLHLIKAMQRIDNEPWSVDIVGDGPLKDAAIQLVRKYQLNDRIRFVGRQDVVQLEKFYQTCTMLVFPSLLPESFGLVGIEAMSFGKPVVAYDAGGVRQWLDHGVNGLVVEHGNIDALADAIITLIGNKAIKMQLSKNAGEMVHRLFNIDQHVDRIIDLYRKRIQLDKEAKR